MFNPTQLTSASLALVLIVLASAASASIENEPVRVTHRNSGPRYDIDEVERTRLAPEGHQSESHPMIAPGFTRSSSREQVSEHESPFGHATVRRIFLIPMMPAAQSGDSSLWSRSHSADKAESESSSTDEQPSPFSSGSNRPFWPFLPSPPRHHLFGSDEASKPKAEASNEQAKAVEQPKSEGDAGEREDSADAERLRPLFDPIQMMLQLMQQALNPNAQAPSTNFFTDLNKDSSSRTDVKPNEAAPNNELSPFDQKAAKANNETREDIVEIDGKKYIRKTIINRHIGENLIFMTKRLIFVPLNETEQEQGKDMNTTTTTSAPDISTVVRDTTTVSSEPINSATSLPEFSSSSSTTTTTTEAARQPEEATTTTTTATSSPSSEAPTSSTAKIEPTQTTTTSGPEQTTAAPSWTDRVSEAIDKAAERIVEAGSVASSTPKPKEV